MTKLSVNVNKIATIRNARGQNTPNIVDAVMNCQKFGADGITVHPRPDERHITKRDIFDIKPKITTEYNIEGYPTDDFIDMVLNVQPNQVTLVPDSPDVITSSSGWDTIKFQSYLKNIISKLKNSGIRTSIFVDPIIDIVQGAKECGADRIELYTEDYANNYNLNKDKAIEPYVIAAKKANEMGIGINAGHDLNLNNLNFFANNIPNLLEVSIGHALISDAIYLGLENTIQMYKRLL
tara:strand:- start:33 stop:743 length:711 start_codon:yes stop_codon:yes gene_type:complete